MENEENKYLWQKEDIEKLKQWGENQPTYDELKQQLQELYDEKYDKAIKDLYEGKNPPKKFIEDEISKIAKLLNTIVEFISTDNFSRFCDLYTESKDTIDKIWELKKNRLLKEQYDILQIGTKIKTIKDRDSRDVKVFPIGTIGEIVDIVSEDENIENYKVQADDDYWWYSRDMFVVID